MVELQVLQVVGHFMQTLLLKYSPSAQVRQTWGLTLEQLLQPWGQMASTVEPSDWVRRVLWGLLVAWQTVPEEHCEQYCLLQMVHSLFIK